MSGLSRRVFLSGLIAAPVVMRIEALMPVRRAPLVFTGVDWGVGGSRSFLVTYRDEYGEFDFEEITAERRMKALAYSFRQTRDEMYKKIDWDKLYGTPGL